MKAVVFLLISCIMGAFADDTICHEIYGQTPDSILQLSSDDYECLSDVCLLRRNGVINEDGGINVDSLIASIKAGVAEGNIHDAIKTCNGDSVTNGNLQDICTALKCMATLIPDTDFNDTF